MELWIRSQDKELLVLAKGFELQNPSYNARCQIFAVWQNNYQCVGNYKSKERALEVLDEIQNILKPKTIVLKDLNKLNEDEMNQFKDILSIIPPVNSIQELPTYVYEMPEE